MKKITIKFEYEIPEKKEAYNNKKSEVIRGLIDEKERMKAYLVSKQDEINEDIDELIKGTNITEAENFLSEVSDRISEEYFSYIGENRQEKVNEIYMAYREIMKGMKTLELFESNNILECEEERISMIKEELSKDIKFLNVILSNEDIHLKIRFDRLLIDKDFYDKDICNVLTRIKNKVKLKVV